MVKFAIGSPVSPKELVDRKEQLDYLTSRMKSRSINYNVAVLGHRRIGKTSILVKLEDELSRDKKFAVVYFDVQKNMAEPRIFFSRLQKAIFDTYLEKLSGLQKTSAKISKIGQFFGNLQSAIESARIKTIGAELRADGIIYPKIEFGESKPNYGDLFLAVFETLKAFAEKSNIKFVVILDEFQDFEKLSRYTGLKNVFDLFRAVIQNRGDNVSYIISGSRVHLLSSILESGSSPLFTHFQRLSITEMDEKNSIVLFNKYLKGRKLKQNDAIAKQAFQILGGQPFYLMALAEEWNPSDDLEEIFIKTLTSSVGILKNYVDYVLTEDIAIAKGGPILRTILRALAESDEGLTYTELSHKISVPTGSLTFYVPSLIDTDLVIYQDKKLIVRDKIIRKFLKIEASEFP